MTGFQEMLQAATTLGERSRELARLAADLNPRVVRLAEKLEDTLGQIEAAKSAFLSQQTAEIETVQQLADVASTVVDEIDSRLQQSCEHLQSRCEQLADDLSDRYEALATQLAELHEESLRELQDQLAGGLDRSSETVKSSVERISEGREKFEEEAERIVARLQSVKAKIESTGSAIGRVLEAVSEAQHMAGVGLRGAAMGLRSIQSVMDEIL